MLNKKQQIGLERLGRTNQYDRINNDTWIFWTPGFETQDHKDTIDFLHVAGFVVINSRFDKVCGKTKSEFRPKKSK